MIYLLTAGVATLPLCYGLRIQVNKALTGTYTVKDGSSTVAVVTNPTVGQPYEYWGFSDVPTVTSSADGDATIMPINSSVSR